ncbi:adenylyltransferase and sulfurtransferase MOCS3-like [Dreissena polymorpha]|uniref:Adenylyltransferase and sulfurtransferase MOCS3 homolog n=1 Tax=Dreissena polymorpha TaxID=45954 RepID=A0A9D4JW23_DREPO|nr:adenylyltransferase and sulfurtransferase MOCS3-like [Dreissena polymorpha]KAH3826865.1 hypothetical protein DPMN_128778 [Dreissena polymorpha]
MKMSACQRSLDDILAEIHKKELEIQLLKEELQLSDDIGCTNPPPTLFQHKERLTNAEISRYSRQLILPEIGVKGQLLLGKTAILIVGAGGLGCPAAIYLAAVGIGKIGIVDYDEVELSNLHRQILHTERKVGLAKCQSVVGACRGLNSFVECVPHHVQFDSSNALDIVKQYDIVLDASDNVATRYLLNDACVIAGKPLVSGSALRFEGQLTVYNHEGGPCYRCLYPKPPPVEAVTNCSDGGVLGVVPGIIGSLQALEAIKLACKMESSYSRKLLLFDALDGRFTAIKLRGRQPSCPVCGDSPTIVRGSLVDYVQFCGAQASDKDKALTVLKQDERITVHDYKQYIEERRPHVLVDVREPVEMDICRLPSPAINISLQNIDKKDSILLIQQNLQELSARENQDIRQVPVICVCRRGNDSQLAVRKLQQALEGGVPICDILGGLMSWAKHVDPSFPTY